MGLLWDDMSHCVQTVQQVAYGLSTVWFSDYSCFCLSPWLLSWGACDLFPAPSPWPGVWHIVGIHD